MLVAKLPGDGSLTGVYGGGRVPYVALPDASTAGYANGEVFITNNNRIGSYKGWILQHLFIVEGQMTSSTSYMIADVSPLVRNEKVTFNGLSGVVSSISEMLLLCLQHPDQAHGQW